MGCGLAVGVWLVLKWSDKQGCGLVGQLRFGEE